MTASYLIKTKAAGRSFTFGLNSVRPRPRRAWHTRLKASSLESARLIAGQAGIRRSKSREAAIFHHGKIVAKLVIALAAILVVGCSSSGPAPEWTVRLDPAGLGYWGAPAGEPLKFYPSAYANPVDNSEGGPDR